MRPGEIAAISRPAGTWTQHTRPGRSALPEHVELRRPAEREQHHQDERAVLLQRLQDAGDPFTHESFAARCRPAAQAGCQLNRNSRALMPTKTYTKRATEGEAPSKRPRRHGTATSAAEAAGWPGRSNDRMPDTRPIAQLVRIDRHRLGPADEADDQQQRAKRSRCASGLSVSRPCRFAVLSPSRVRDPCVGQLVNRKPNQQDHGLGKQGDRIEIEQLALQSSGWPEL